IGGNKTQYTYQVRVDTTSPVAPSTATARSPQARDLAVSWTTSTDTLSGLHASEATYAEISSITDGGSVVRYSGWLSRDTTSYTFSNITGNTTYYARIKHRDAAYNESSWVSTSAYLAAGVFVTVSSAAGSTLGPGTRNNLLQLAMYAEEGTSTKLQEIYLSTYSSTLPSGQFTFLLLNESLSVIGGSDEGTFVTKSTITLSSPQPDLDSTTKYFYIAVTPLKTTLPGTDKTIGVTVSGSSFKYSTPHQTRSNIGGGFSSPAPYVEDGVNTVRVTPTALAPSELVRGSTNYVMIKLRLSIPSGFGTAEMKQFILKTTGTATSADVTALRIYLDANRNGTLDAGTDIPLGNDVIFAGGIATFTVTHAAQSTRTVTSDSPIDLFVAVDISAGATPGSTLGVYIASYTHVQWNSSNDSTENSGFPAQSGISLITLPHILTADATNLASATVPQGALAAMAKIRMWTDRSSALWDRLKVDLKSGEYNTDVKQVYLYRDDTADGSFQTADTIISSTTFSTGGTALLNFSTETVSVSTKTYFVVYSLDGNAIAGDTLTAKLLTAGSLRILTSQTSFYAVGIPLESASSVITETADTMLFNGEVMDNTSNIQQGAVNPLFLLRVVMGTNGGSWTGLKLYKYGSVTDSEIEKIALWRSDDKNFSATADTKVAEGSLFNGSVSLGLTAQSLDTTTRYYMITASMTANAVVGSTFNVVIQSTADVTIAGAADSVYAGAFPMNAGGVLQLTSIQQYPNIVTVAFTTNTAPSRVTVGDKKVLMAALRLYSDLNNVTLSQLRVDAAGSSPQNIDRIALAADTNESGSYEEISDLVIASGALSGTNAVFSNLNQTIASGNSYSGGKRFFVTVDVASAATPSHYFSLYWGANNYFTVNNPNSVSSITFGTSGVYSSTVTIKPPPIVLYSSITSLAPSLIYQGERDVPMLKLRFWTMDPYDVSVEKLKVNLTGGALDSAVSRIKIYKDNGDGSFGIGDSQVNSGNEKFASGTSLVALSPTVSVGVSTVTLFVLYDVDGGAALNGSITMGCGMNSVSYISVDSPNTVNDLGFPVYSSNTSVNPTVAALNVSAEDAAQPYVAQASTGTIFLRLTLSTTLYTLSLQGMTLTKTGSLADSYVKNIHIYEDIDGNKLLSGRDSELTSGSNIFADGASAIYFNRLLTVSTASAKLLIGMDFSEVATVGSTVAVRVGAYTAFFVNSPNIITNSGYPMSSFASQIDDKTDYAKISFDDIASAETAPGTTDFAAVKITAFTDADSATITSFRFDKTGTLEDAGVGRLRLWRDNGDGSFTGAGNETAVASATMASGFSLFSSLAETIGVSTKTYFLTADISSAASANATLGLRIAAGYAVASGTDAVSSFNIFSTKSVRVRSLAAPSMPVVKDESDYTSATTKLFASWSSTVDQGTITGYEYSVGTSSGATDVVSWTSVQTATYTEITGLALVSGTTYFINVKATGSSTLVSQTGSSDGIAVDTQKPKFTEAPEAQAESNNIIISWTPPSVAGFSGIAEYIVEERRGDSPTWVQIVSYSTAGARSLAAGTPVIGASALGYSPQGGYVALVSTASAALTSSAKLQIIITNRSAGTYYYRTRARSNANSTSEPSSETRIVLDAASKAEVISNIQAYPNPVDTRKASASIYYDLNQDSDVEITIYDLFGKIVKTLNYPIASNGGRLGGNEIKWNGQRDDGQPVSFGVYLIRIKAKATGDSKIYKLGIVH
ncbi:MAG: hypothetical protein HY547_08915, partial [Elusimicrobia bacterium]|nr:hypothetical protein [Elusimicrobiota bacterium]